jgi:hypothetical protein
MNTVNISNYSSNSGLSTKHWGPSGWYFLFSCIMGAYPISIDRANPEHKQIRKHFYEMLSGLMYTMPCSFCRNSYRDFFLELPIKPFLTGRIQLMYWLYQIRDKVNKKLINQELECYGNKKRELCNLLSTNKISKIQFLQDLKKYKSEILITKKSPPFKEVLQKFENLRAKCLPSAKTCSLK